MASSQLKKSEKSRPHCKRRVGRFQISTWRIPYLLSNGNPNSTIYIEKQIDVDRVCIQYSRFNKATHRWVNQQIWCSPEDLRDLAEAVDRLNEEDGSSSSKEGLARNKVKGFSQQGEENPGEVV
jgi:hypothetical protein